MAPAKLVFGIAAVALTLMAPGFVNAQTCTSDADCTKGLTCQSDGSRTITTCATDSTGSGGCTSVSAPATKSCQLGPCTTAADCGADMICHSETYTSCTGSAPVEVKCDLAAAECPAAPPPEPASCTEKTVATCMYPWLLPCNTDADCGANFTCRPSQIGMCSGSTGPASSGGTSAEGTGGASGPTIAPTPPDFDASAGTTATCTIITTYPGSCTPNEIACTGDADCPASWTCDQSRTTATAPGMPVAIDGGAEPVPPPADDLNAPVATTTPAKVCRPPLSTKYTTGGPTLGGTEDGSSQAPTGASGAVDGGTPPTIALAPSDTGSSTTAGTPPNPTANTRGTNNEGGAVTQTAASTSGGGGCSVATGAGVADSAWLLGLVAALGMLVARRRGRSR